MDIEFRAWDTIGKVMLDWLCINQTAFNRKNENDYALIYEIFNNPNFIKMQYTGHKGIDNVKIFDRDIIEYTAIINHKGRIFHNVIEYFESCNNCGFMIIGKDRRVRYNLCRDQIWNHKIKVVGNMCLTPKLMNE